MSENTNERQAIVYIAALGASGTTILSILLSQMENVVNLGEIEASLRAIQNKSKIKDKCTCGEEMQNCEFWGKIMETAKDGDSIEQLYGILLKNFRQLFPGKTIIDNSKFTKGLDKRWLSPNLAKLVDIKFIHIIRDYRGWALSTERIYSTYAGYKGRKKHLIFHCLAWLIRNRSREKFIKSSRLPVLTLPYESLIFNTEEELRRIANFTNLKVSDKDRRSENILSHDCHGNSMRMDPKRRSELKYDNKWTFDIRFILFAPLLIPVQLYWRKINTNRDK